MGDRKLIKCKISKKDLKFLYDKLCVDKDTKDQHCDKCPLGRMEWKVDETGFVTRDLCFAIWHSEILEEWYIVKE